MSVRSQNTLLKALVVDDASDLRLYVATLLKKWGYETFTAASAQDGLAEIQSRDIQLVICDWMMPGMSGPELCRAVRDTDLGRYVYFVLLTARTDKGDLLEGLNSGADDFLTKPFDAHVLRARLRVGERIISLERRLAERNQELIESRQALEKAYQQIQFDLAAAARVQDQMLPRSVPFAAPIRCDWLFLPAAEVSGDSFNLFGLSVDLLGFFLFDVSGHGIPAALLSARLGCSLIPAGASPDRPVERRFPGPASFLVALNERMTDADTEVENYATLVYGVLNKRTGQCELVLAGHPPALVLRHAGGLEELGPGGFPLGMFPGVGYDPIALCLEPGDRLILYSDGVTECRDPAGREFGHERFRELINSCAATDTSTLISLLDTRLRQWRAVEDFADDVSLMILHRGIET